MTEPMKVTLAGPIDTKGRYPGGITYIVKMLLHSEIADTPEMKLIAFDTCRISRGKLNAGKWTIGNLRNTVVTARDLRKHLREEKPNLLYFNTSRGYALIKDLLVIKAAKGCTCRTILHIHYAQADKIIPPGRRMRKLFLKLVKTQVDHIVLLSEVTRAQFAAWGIPECKMTVIYNCHSLQITDEEIRKKLSTVLDKPGKDILFLGSLDERKGILDLIAAVENVSSNVTLHVCGLAKSKSVEDQILEKTKSMKNLILHGFVDGEEKKRLLLNADILALPSYGEGFPIVLVEGLAAGCAIITTDVGAIPEVFSDDNGKIISPGDVESLTSTIDGLCSSNRLKTVMERNRDLSQHYSQSAFCESMLTTCRKVCNETEVLLRCSNPV